MADTRISYDFGAVALADLSTATLVDIERATVRKLMHHDDLEAKTRASEILRYKQELADVVAERKARA